MSACFVLGGATFLAVATLSARVGATPGELNTREFPDTGAAVIGVGAGLLAAALLAAAFHARDRVARLPSRQRGQWLLPAAYRPFVWLVVLPGLVTLAGLSLRVAHVRGPVPPDRLIDSRLIYRFHDLHGLLHLITQLGSPLGVGLLSAGLCLLCLRLRRWRAAAYLAAGPAASGTLTEYALKPLIGRHSGAAYAFPSGHTTGAVAVAAGIVIVLLPGGVLDHVPRRVYPVAAAVVALLVSGVPLGLIVLRIHYVTDVLAGFAVATSAMVLLALGLDTVALAAHKRRKRRTGGQPQDGYLTEHPASAGP